MERRRYLTGAGTILTLGVSGCTGGGSEESDKSEDGSAGSDDANDSDATTNPDATEALEAAREDLNEALDLILEEIDTAWAYSSTDASISTAGVEAALGSANTSIEEANETATTDTQREQVAELELVAEFIDQFLNAIISLGEGINQISTAISYENNSRYEDAADSLSDARATFEEANSQVDEMDATFAELGDGTGTGIDYAEAENAIDEMNELIAGYLLVMEAGIPLDRGLADYNTAYEAFQDEDYGTAANIFADALEHLEEAESMYREGEEEVTQSLRDTFITQTCYAGKYVEITELMLEASEEADAGNFDEARSLAEEANAVSIETCG
ncbi:hypothetical protein EXE46_06010 [Halorubrum sp. GN11_10-6_MGM]|uniref:hypothetical protein n=1 Tax=Halorubrum sp. GN11_10-6_MGM TaxID=2518112 RepID=UPI0010F7FEC4|nr:hypothetical protein [Halorubrum sp. GN11_10-6_MGM]TKX74966.1 hypothetical protein EXE46_06010 [Halorubrum sp. GN11_10-6_MGM]